MYTPNVKTKVDVEVTLDCIPIETVLKEICEKCHDGLEDVSIFRQECDENPSLNTAKNWKNECENLEGILCKILTYLGD